jgi:hypothetical protein
MTDRAKKISELSTTSSVANTDKIVVLKDAANTSAASTRAMTINAFAQIMTPLVQAPIANTVSISNTVTVQSNGQTPVPFFSYTFPSGKTGCCDIQFHARDPAGNNITAGSITVVANNTAISKLETVHEIGGDVISFDSEPTLSGNLVTLYLRRGEFVSTSNVIVRFSALLF